MPLTRFPLHLTAFPQVLAGRRSNDGRLIAISIPVAPLIVAGSPHSYSGYTNLKPDANLEFANLTHAGVSLIFMRSGYRLFSGGFCQSRFDADFPRQACTNMLDRARPIKILGSVPTGVL